MTKEQQGSGKRSGAGVLIPSGGWFTYFIIYMNETLEASTEFEIKWRDVCDLILENS